MGEGRGGHAMRRSAADASDLASIIMYQVSGCLPTYFTLGASSNLSPRVDNQ